MFEDFFGNALFFNGQPVAAGPKEVETDTFDGNRRRACGMSERLCAQAGNLLLAPTTSDIVATFREQLKASPPT